MTLNGSCLCSAVSFAIDGKVTDIYQCHCSVCRKATGSSGISVFLASGACFRWLSGESNIRLYVTESGFCTTCGSRLPDPNPEGTTFWVPAGLMDDRDLGVKVGAHIFVGSKAAWDAIGDDGVLHDHHFSI